MEIISHGIHFIRTGECKRCEACEKLSCPHFKMVDDLATCLTYGKGDYLEKKCYEFPDNPFVDLTNYKDGNNVITCRVYQEAK